MGRKALLESLRSKAGEDAAGLWRDARAGAEARRLELAQALEQERGRQAQAAAALAQGLEDEALAEAQHRARGLRTRAALALADRCRRLAMEELPRLRGEGGAALFRALAQELPVRAWRRVRVNPADRDLAGEVFPGAEVECEESVAGGMEVEAEDGRIRISNTLETRLATAWPDVLPGLIGALLPESRDDRTAA